MARFNKRLETLFNKEEAKIREKFRYMYFYEGFLYIATGHYLFKQHLSLYNFTPEEISSLNKKAVDIEMVLILRKIKNLNFDTKKEVFCNGSKFFILKPYNFSDLERSDNIWVDRFIKTMESLFSRDTHEKKLQKEEEFVFSLNVNFLSKIINCMFAYSFMNNGRLNFSFLSKKAPVLIYSQEAKDYKTPNRSEKAILMPIYETE